MARRRSVAMTPRRETEGLRVALVQDWLTGMRGGEWVLHEIADLFPGADIFTIVHARGSVTPEIEARRIHTSFVQRLPGGVRHYRRYLPILPLAAESFDLSGYDLVLSSSHCVAKGVRPPPAALHLSYVHTPMRYVWHRYQDYARGRSPLARAAMSVAARGLRAWDVSSSRRVHRFLANSQTVARRIGEVYGRPAEVVHPPVDTAFFTPAEGGRAEGAGPGGGYDLLVSALVPYKRVDLALDAYRGLDRRLVVVGTGPSEAALRRGAPANVAFTGWTSREELRDLYRGARALVFPAVEDFGMAPVESLACGRPVVAFAEGGVTETVEGPVAGSSGPTGEWVGTAHGGGRGEATGVFFRPQTPEALAAALGELGRMRFDSGHLRRSALRFDRARFRERYLAAVHRLLDAGRGAREDDAARHGRRAGARADDRERGSEGDAPCAPRAASSIG